MVKSQCFGASKVARQENVLATKPDELSSIPRTHIIKYFFKSVLWN